MVYYPVYEPPEGAKKCNVGKHLFVLRMMNAEQILLRKNMYKQKSVRAESEFDEKSDVIIYSQVYFQNLLFWR